MATPKSRTYSDADGLQNLYPTVWERYKAKHRDPIPAEVWGFFHDLQLLQNAREDDAIEDVVWALWIFVTAVVHPDRRTSAEVAKWILVSLPIKEHEAWYHVVDQEGRRLEFLVQSHPDPQSMWRYVETSAKSPGAVAVLLLDFDERWRLLHPWQRSFLSKRAVSGSPAPFKEAREVADSMNPDLFAFLLPRQLMRAGTSQLALNLLCEVSGKQLSDVVEFGDPPERHSYFELHTRFLTHNASTEATAFLWHLVKTEAYADDSLMVFMQNEKLKDVVAFVLEYISYARQRPGSSSLSSRSVSRSSPSSPQPRKKCCSWLCGSSKQPSASANPSLLLRTSNVPQVLLKELLVKYEGHDTGGREFLLHEREFQQAFELFLLLSESDVIIRIIERLNDDHQEFMRTGLREWARLHFMRVLDNCRSTYDANCRAINDLVGKKGLWTWAASEGRNEYFASDARNSEDIAIVLWMFFEVGMFLDPTIISKFLLYGKNREPPLDIMDTFMPEKSYFFDAIAKEVCKRQPNLVHKEVKALMRNPGYYDPGIQGFLREGAVEKPRAVFHDDLAFARVMQVVGRLFSFRDGSMDQHTLESSLDQICSACDGDATCLNLMKRVMEATLEKKDVDFLPDGGDPTSDPSAFTVAGLASCARRLRVACDTVRNQPVQLTFGRVVNAFLEMAPRGWVPLFNSLETVLFFLRFMEREDLTLSYEKFTSENEEIFKTDDSVRRLLEDAKDFYTEPIVNMDDGVTDLCSLDVRGKLAKRKLPPGKTKSKKTSPSEHRFTNDDWNLVLEIAASAAESMKEKYNVPMLPHHTQMITLLMFASQMCRGPGEFAMPRTVLARVGTGEGKSWIIGMLAAFVAKKGMIAHVVIDNDTLLERDFNTMSALFQNFNITACKGTLGKEHQVVYCSCMDIELHFMEKMKEGKADIDFRRCVMIVDEVDSLIVDDNVYQCYVDDYYEGTDVAEWWWARGKNESKYNHEAWKRKVMESLEKADMETHGKMEGRNFVFDDNGMVWALDERTALVKRSAWYLWLELLRKQYVTDYRVRYMTRQNVICKKSCFGSYSFIFGLTGSLGTGAEQAYTKKHFNASVFMVPNFLDTCRGTSRPRAKCISTYTENNSLSQLQRTAEIVQDNIASVPILVVTRDPDRVQTVANRLREVLLDHAVGDKLGPGIIELLDRPGKEAEFQQLVEVATQPLETLSHTGKNMRQWRVTVTTAIGARGQDYHLSDELVDEKGGFLLILEYVPDSEREWIQFLGRTARHDHPGQYAVVLNMEDYRDFLGYGTVDPANIVKRILDHVNTTNEKRLKETEEQLDRGMLMHTLTAKFWEWGKTKKSDKKLWQDKFSEWVELCETFEGKNLDEIKQAFKELDLGVSAETADKDNNRANNFWEIVPLIAQPTTGIDAGQYTGARDSKGLRHGHGRCAFPDGRVFEGQWDNGKMSGHGKMVYKDGKIYEGQFSDDKRAGDGTISFANGQVYTGQWVKGKQHGHGTYKSEKGATWTGKWADGKKVADSVEVETHV